MAETVDLDAFEAWTREPYAGGHSPEEVASHALVWSRKVIAELREARAVDTGYAKAFQEAAAVAAELGAVFARFDNALDRLGAAEAAMRP